MDQPRYCACCKLAPRVGDPMCMLRFWPEDEQFAGLIADAHEPPEQTSICVIACSECREKRMPAYLERLKVEGGTMGSYNLM